MTGGHKHRLIGVRNGSWLYRVLRYPILHTRNIRWADESRLVFGPCEKHGDDCWCLSLLGLLHGLTGLTIEVK